MSVRSRLSKNSAKTPESLAARTIERASERGLVDVTYDELSTPLGTWFAAMTRKGLVRIAFRHDFDDVLDEIAEKISPRIVRKRLDDLQRVVDDYFEGRTRDFDIPLDWQLVTGFNERVLRATAKIPYGSVSTYGAMARSAGSPRAARAAGNALHNNPIPFVVPCHRVVGSDGRLVGYGGGLDMKEFLLKLEGALGD